MRSFLFVSSILLVLVANGSILRQSERPRQSTTTSVADQSQIAKIKLANGPIQHTADHGDFLEITMDVGTLTDGTYCNLSNPVFRTLVGHLGYKNIRVGGTEGDETFYDMTNQNVTTNISKPPLHPPFTRTLTAGTWDLFIEFVRNLDLQVVFGLNAGPWVRSSEGAWTPQMAETFISYNTAKEGQGKGNNKKFMLGYEFGNEPDLYLLNFKGNLDFANGSQWARDMAVVRKSVSDYDASLLTLCCDVMYTPLFGELGTFYDDFFAAGGLSFVNVTTWHFYDLFATGIDKYLPKWIDPFYATPERMANPLILDQVWYWGTRLIEDVKRHFDGEVPKPIWLGETGSASFGGQRNSSNCFVDSIQYFDKIGILGQLGNQKMFRQEVCASHWTTTSKSTTTVGSPPYTLLDAEFNARPTYFSTILAKKLIGGTIYGTSNSADGLFRAYATSNAQNSSRSILVLINLRADLSVPFQLEFEGGAPFSLSQNMTGYLLEGSAVITKNSPTSNEVLSSTSLTLNRGAPLKVSTVDGSLPSMQGLSAMWLQQQHSSSSSSSDVFSVTPPGLDSMPPHSILLLELD